MPSDDNNYELRDEYLFAISQAIKEVCKFPLMKNCLTCKNFDEMNEMCNKYKQMPPARVIAYGCVGYDDVKEIPF